MMMGPYKSSVSNSHIVHTIAGFIEKKTGIYAHLHRTI